MKIHAIRTVTVRVKPSQQVGRGHGAMRQQDVVIQASR
jgi:hypothetical protein